MHNVQIKLILLVVFEVFGNNISKKISKLQNFVAFEIETLKRIRSSNSGLLLLKCGIFPVKWIRFSSSQYKKQCVSKFQLIVLEVKIRPRAKILG